MRNRATKATTISTHIQGASHELIGHVAPNTPAWTAARGTLWQQAAALRSLVVQQRIDYVVIDSIVFACPGADPSDYAQYRLRASDPRPGELTPGAKQTWMYSADQESGNEPVNSDPRELHGVRALRIGSIILQGRLEPREQIAAAVMTGDAHTGILTARGPRRPGRNR